jgi:ABC-2 type transport system permease protein
VSAITVAGLAPVIRTRSPLGRLAWTEFKLLLRERVRLLFGIAFPIILLVIFGAIPSFNVPHANLGGHTTLDVYVPILVAFATAVMSITALPMMTADYRERGILRRLRTTPIGPERVLGAQMAANLVVVLTTMVLIVAVARLGYGVPLPRQLGGFVLAAVLAAAALQGLGLVIAAVAPNGRAAQITGALLFYPMMFFAGLWLPIQVMPRVLAHVSNATPLGAAVSALNAAANGHFPSGQYLLTLAAYAIGFGVVAAKLFRWE